MRILRIGKISGNKYKYNIDIIEGKKEDIIGPINEGDIINLPKPTGYVVLTYRDGNNGYIISPNVYYINPTKNIAFGTILAPYIDVDTGYGFTGWDVPDDFIIKEDTNATAQYMQAFDIEDVVSIDLGNFPNKRIYNVNEFFDPTGMIIVLRDGNGVEKQFTDDMFSENFLEVIADIDLLKQPQHLLVLDFQNLCLFIQ